MESGYYRLKLGMVVLMTCAVIAWTGDDSTPTREVTEVVSIIYKPARPMPSNPEAAEPEVAVNVANFAAAAPVAGTASVPLGIPVPALRTDVASQSSPAPRAINAKSSGTSKQFVQAQGRPSVEQPKAVSGVFRPHRADTRSPTASALKANVARPVCRHGPCSARANTRKPEVKQQQVQQAAKAQARIPAPLHALQRLGLFLQARLGNPPVDSATRRRAQQSAAHYRSQTATDE